MIVIGEGVMGDMHFLSRIKDIIRTDGISSLNRNVVFFLQMSPKNMYACMFVLFAAINVACFAVSLVWFPQSTANSMSLLDVLQNGTFRRKVTVAIIAVWHSDFAVFRGLLYVDRLEG